MKALISNKMFWIILAAVVIATFIIARTKTGNTIAASATKVIPLGSAAETTTTTTVKAV